MQAASSSAEAVYNAVVRARPVRGFPLALATVALCACSPSDSGDTWTTSAPSQANHASISPTGMSSSPAHHHASSAWGFRIDVPAGWAIHHDFSQSYLANGAWKTYAGTDSSGTPVVALTLPGSNRITDAEIRIGASRDGQALHDCTMPPQAVRAGSVGDATINEIRFTRFEAGDAAMSHHLDVHSYRVVHDGACYAIDLLVYGVNPQVYDPPATPPFTDQQAFARMRAVLETFRFTR